MCSPHLYPHLRWTFNAAHGNTKHASRFHLRTQDFIVVIGSLNAIDAASHRIDQSLRSVKFVTPISQSASIPTYLPRQSIRCRGIAE